jgi:PAS domain S-box-containing protein
MPLADQVIEFFSKLFSDSGFPPRWHCGRWTDFHGWLYIISDLMIWAAYFAIPIIIIRFITRKQGARFQKIYFLFAAFILACGTTHLLDAITFWYPAYRFNALMRFATGVVSWLTVFHLVRLLPAAFSLKTADQLETEVHQREKAETQLQINNRFLNEAQEIAKLGHWNWDVAANKITWSDTMMKIYGSTQNDALTYSDYLSKVHPDDREDVNGYIEQAMSTKKFVEFYHRTLLPDGTVKTLHAKGEVITDTNGNVTSMFGTGQDVTKTKEVEQQLLAKSKELELTNRELEKFASIASHDLREPLRKIITFAGMLETEYKDVLGDKGRTYLEKMVSSSQRMQHLIDDILEFSGLSSGNVTFENVGLGGVVTQVLSDIEVLVAEKQAQITVDALPDVEGNKAQLGLLFQNIIANAIKFSKEETRPEVHIHADVIKGRELPADHLKLNMQHFSILQDPRFWDNEKFCRISIQDNGIGFDEVYIDKIFALFQRLHSKSEYEGTGIGLAVCKKVVDIHHGTITATSKQGEGSVFIITLPVSQRHFRHVPASNGGVA